MRARGLRLAPPPVASPAPRRASRAAACGIGAFVLASALGASLLGADRARSPGLAAEEALAALAVAFDEGHDAPRVRETLVALRGRLGERPLDGRTRVVYAALLLELGSRYADCGAVAFHALRAAALAPVTVPVVRAAALIVARCADSDAALGLTRAMFAYDPEAAATLLSSLEALVPASEIRGAIPDLPAAWLARFDVLRRERRFEEAGAWLREAVAEFPDHLPLLDRASALAVADEDWESLDRLLPPAVALPEEPEAATLHAYRALGRAARGDRGGALAAARTAARLCGARHGDRIVVGDALLAAGAHEEARARWRRALYDLPSGASARPLRMRLLLRLARLEQAHGSSADELRAWREVLKEDPEQPEARRRLDVLGGLRP